MNNSKREGNQRQHEGKSQRKQTFNQQIPLNKISDLCFFVSFFDLQHRKMQFSCFHEKSDRKAHGVLLLCCDEHFKYHYLV